MPFFIQSVKVIEEYDFIVLNKTAWTFYYSK